MTPYPYEREIDVVVRVVRHAALATEAIRKKDLKILEKGDGTPVTQADIVSQAIILAGIEANFPEDAVSAEEVLEAGEKETLRAAAVCFLKDLNLSREASHLEERVNYRGNPGGKRIWMVDPIDGTKGFRKGLGYAVAVGLYEGGRPRLGVMGLPRFAGGKGNPPGMVTAYGAEGRGAYVLEGAGDAPRRIHVSRRKDVSRLRIVGSRAHDRVDICGRFARETGAPDVVHMDSMAKYLMVASGRADLYLKVSDPDFGIAFPWDHCAGQVLLEEAGGRVTGLAGEPLNYEQREGSPIRDTDGLVASNGACHEEALAIIESLG